MAFQNVCREGRPPRCIVATWESGGPVQALKGHDTVSECTCTQDNLACSILEQFVRSRLGSPNSQPIISHLFLCASFRFSPSAATLSFRELWGKCVLHVVFVFLGHCLLNPTGLNGFGLPMCFACEGRIYIAWTISSACRDDFKLQATK